MRVFLNLIAHYILVDWYLGTYTVILTFTNILVYWYTGIMAYWYIYKLIKYEIIFEFNSSLYIGTLVPWHTVILIY